MTVTSSPEPNVTWTTATLNPTVQGHSNHDPIFPNRSADHICGNYSVPTAYWFVTHLSDKQLILLVIYALSTLVTILLYLDETVFIVRRFVKHRERRHRTIWVLAVFPVFSLTGLLGFMVPLAAPIVDLVANTFMACCLYNMLELMMCYLGGHEGLWQIVEEDQLSVQFATLPVCCLLPCLPQKKLDRVLLGRLRILVLQVCIIRPIIMFIAAVMWANGTYNHDGLDFKTGDPYIAIINALTTILAVFGLNLVKTALRRPLKGFWLGGKVFVIQMVLATCSLSPAITKLFDRWGLVRCDPPYIQRVHLDSIYRGVLVISMLIYSITARLLYRRAADATTEVTSYVPQIEPNLKTKLLRILNIPREAISRSKRNKGQKPLDMSNGHVEGANTTAGPDVFKESKHDLPKSRSPRRSHTSDREDSQLMYMDDTIDETTSLTLEYESDSDINMYGGRHHAIVNESMVISNSE